MTLKHFIDLRDQYETDLRQWSRDQVSLWRQLPWLALQADGRRGFSDHYAACYRNGIWMIRSSEQSGYYRVTVDCGTGEFYNMNKPLSLGSSAIHLMNPEELDVALIIEQLKKFDKSKDHSIQNNAMDMDWREKNAKEYGLTEIYTRQRSIPEPYWGID